MPGMPDVGPIRVSFCKLFQAESISRAGSYQKEMLPVKMVTDAIIPLNNQEKMPKRSVNLLFIALEIFEVAYRKSKR